MLDEIKAFVKGVINRMFPAKNVEQALKIETCISSMMQTRIELWQRMYSGMAPWCKGYVKSLRKEQGICTEFANICLDEMESNISVEELDQIYKMATRDLNENLQSGLALGALIIKPLGGDKVEYVTADRFVPIAYDERERLIDVVFVENQKRGEDYYHRLERHSLRDNILTITTGAFSYDTILKRIIKDMTRSGLRTVEYASGRTYRVDSACRTALMTGFRQIVGRMNEQVAAELDTDTYEVTYHIGARPEHQAWQGKVYSYKDLESVCGLGTVTGLCGANCYHWYDVFIQGVSVRNYTDEELQEMIDEENEKTSYDGKEYTTYEALQRQRKLELTMRVYRQDIKLMKEGGVSELEIMGAKARYKKTMDEYVKFSKVMKLPEQRDRIYMDGLGRISTKVGKKILSSMKISIPKEVAEKAGLDKSVEKKINQAIKKLDKEYTIYLDSIEGGKLGRGDLFVSGAYLDKDGMLKHGLVFNYNIDYNKFESRIKMLYSTGYMAGKSYEDYIAHEMAHIIPFQNCVTKKDYDKLTDEIYKSFVKGISKYADKEHDGRESLAEAFVRYRNGEKIPDESRKLIEKYILPWRRK